MEDHLEVLKIAIAILQPLFPSTIPVTVLGDGEFDAIERQELFLSIGWNYVLRTACNTVLFEQGQRFEAKAVSPEKTHNCHFIPQLEFTKKRFKYVSFVCWHDQKINEKPIFLISNLLCPGKIIDSCYA